MTDDDFQENPASDVLANEPVGYVILSDSTTASDYALKNLNASLGHAQSEFTDSVKDAENKYGGWKYTPLTNIIAAIRPALTKHHLTLSQFPETDLARKTVKVITRLVHWDSGEWSQNVLELPAELALGKDGSPKFNQQTIGGTITYGQKYAIKPIAGIADDEETIDSTEDKGDLPARGKPQPKPAPIQRQEASKFDRSKFLQTAKGYGWGLDQIKAYFTKTVENYRSSSQLSDGQMEAALLLFSKKKPEELLAPEAQE